MLLGPVTAVRLTVRERLGKWLKPVAGRPGGDGFPAGRLLLISPSRAPIAIRRPGHRLRIVNASRPGRMVPRLSAVRVLTAGVRVTGVLVARVRIVGVPIAGVPIARVRIAGVLVIRVFLIRVRAASWSCREVTVSRTGRVIRRARLAGVRRRHGRIPVAGTSGAVRMAGAGLVRVARRGSAVRIAGGGLVRVLRGR